MKKNKKNKTKIILIILLVAVLIRITLPAAIKVALNNYLEDFSPTIQAHVDNVDLAIIRGSATIHRVTASTKEKDKEFLKIDSANVKILWSDLFKSQIASNILIDGIDFNITKDLLPAVQKHLASMKKEEKKEPLDITIRRFDIINSKVRTEFIQSLTNADNSLLTDIKARAANISAASQNLPLSLQAKILESGSLKVEGEANLTAKSWSIDSEILKFNLTEMNPFLKNNVPITFTQGQLDLYSEAKSEGGVITGYAKPFIKSLDVIKTQENFLGAKHWFIEILTALSNITLKSDDVVATRIPFTFKDKFTVDGGESIAKVLEHGFVQEQNRGIENSIELKQSQEEK